MKKIIPWLFFGLASVALFNKFFLRGKVPVPGDILLGHYYPFIDLRWEGRSTVYPIKNWLLFDGIRQTLPWRLLAIDTMKNHKLPLWNPYIFSGMPLLANWQTAALYPLNVLFWIFGRLNAWSIYVFFQPFLAGILMFYFLKDLTGKKFSAYLGGIGWGFSLIMLNHLEFGIDGHTALWLPLGLLAVNRLTRRFQYRWGLALSLAVCLTFLGGYPPLMIYSSLILTAYIVFKSRPIFSRKTLVLFLFLILGVGLSGPQTIPALELSHRVIREEANFGKTSTEAYFLPLENLLMSFAPDLFGHPSTWNFRSKIAYTDNASVGAAAFVFWSAGFYFLFRRKQERRSRKELAFWAAAALIPTMLMIDFWPGRLLRGIPINFFSLVTPMRMIWVVAFSLSAVAALSAKIIWEDKDILRSFRIPLLLIVFAWIFPLWGIKAEGKLTAWRNLVLPTGVAVFTMTVIFLSSRFRRTIKIAYGMIVLVALLELLRQGWKYNPFIDPKLVFPQTKITEFVSQNSQGYRTLINHHQLFPVNANIPYRIPMADGYASIRDSQYDYFARLLNSNEKVTSLVASPRIIFSKNYQNQVVDLAGVRYVLALADLNDSKLKLVMSEGETRLYENTTVFPKAFFVEKCLAEGDLLQVVNNMLNTNLREVAVLPASVRPIPQLSLGKAKISQYEDNRVVIETENEGTGFLVLADSYDLGWQANIDGQKTLVQQTNLYQRGVLVPPGRHQIVFNYFPQSLVIGVYVGGFSAVTVLTLFFFRKKVK